MADDDRADKARQLSENMRTQFEEVIRMLDASDAWTDFQDTFDQVHSLLIAMDPDARRHSIEMLASYIELSLLGKGFRQDEVTWIKKSIICNWQSACECKERLEAKEIYHRANAQWSKVNSHCQVNVGHNDPLFVSLVAPLGRLFTGAAALVLDALKILTISPVPNFVAITIMGGAALFLNGVEGILTDGGRAAAD